MTFHHLSGHELLRLIGSIAAAYLLALPLGWERKLHSHAYVGLRVFPLVAVGACVYVFLGQQLFTGSDSNEQADVLQGLMTGIGFVGAGAIIKESGGVHGVATAAAIWTTGAIGAAVAYGYYALALTLSLVNLLILSVTSKLARRAREAVASQLANEGEG
jgi:putative Mg2+ transporter-C (MgtC) family protein